jgi:hypothetical protein
MNYKITYKYNGIEHAVLLQDQQNILGAIYQFVEDHEKGCDILKIEQY